MEKKEYLEEGYVERMRAEELCIDPEENAYLASEERVPEPLPPRAEGEA